MSISKPVSMKKILFFLFLLFTHSLLQAQNTVKPNDPVENNQDPGWLILKKWIDSAKNNVEVLLADSVQSREALVLTQLSTRSPIGSILFFTGGILIDHGWIRILGSGNKKLLRSLPSWNQGKSPENINDSGFYLIADDAVGGFFAINTARPHNENVGKVFYLSPDRLEWEDLDLTYTEFLLFCLSGDLNKFYGSLRWKDWEKDVKKMDADKVFNFTPPLWSSQGKDISKNKKQAVPAGEQFDNNVMMRKKLKLDKKIK